MTIDTDLQSTIPHESTRMKLRLRRWIAVIALISVLSLGTILAAIRSAQSAAEIEYFNALPTSFAVLLEWSTRSEYNVARFDILCKLAAEPDSAYHRIGSRPAKGSPGQGALYDFPVTELQPGVAYCFQLHEVTTDDEPGERRTLCGYGLSMTPTPVSPFATLTQTLFPSGTMTSSFDSLVTPFTPQFPQQPTSPLGTPTPLGAAPEQPTAIAEAATATATTPLGPDVAQTGAGDGAIDAASNAGGPGVPAPLPTTEASTPELPTVEQPLAVVTTVNADGLPTVAATDTFTPTSTPVTAALAADVSADIPEDSSARMGEAAVGAAAVMGEPTATPTSLYVVVTAAPTLAPVALSALLTPWPTATPIPGAQLTSILVPTAQNLTVMLLCFIFFSATSLGALGLITSVLYMRSRSQRELLETQRRSRLR